VNLRPQAGQVYHFEINNLPLGIRRANDSPMPVVFIGLFSIKSRKTVPPLAASALLLSAAITLPAGQAFLREAAETNVNQRYVIESVSLAGVAVTQIEPSKLPKTLRQRLTALIGERCDAAMLDELSSQIRKELHLRAVTEHLSRGSAPDRVKVNFEVVRRDLGFDVSLPKFLYHSKQGFTGELDASTRFKQNNFSFGVVSNGDDLTERFTGMTARYDSAAVGSDRLHFGLMFEDYHEQWDVATRHALGQATTGLDIYRSRWNVAPQATFAIARPLTVSLGASFERMDSELPASGGRSANSATLDVHYGHKIESSVQQQIDGKYSLRVATRALGSTYAYARHMISAKYEAKTGRHTASDEFIAGSIAGQAPFFERFVLGSSSTLRGWDRYEIDPLGGSRVVHNELTYGYRVGEGTVEGFYDIGALWQSDKSAKLRHSLGVGYRQGIFVLTMAFPVRNGRIEPVFMAGMNY
jgi:hypothetical protein